MRSILLICISYIIGIIWGLYNIYIALIFLPILIFGAVMYHKQSKTKYEAFLIVLVYVLGLTYVNVKLHDFKNKYEEGSIQDSGYIKSITGESESYYKYVFVNKAGNKFLLYAKKNILVSEMDLIEIKGSFQKPTVRRNEGCFDYSKYLFSQGIYGSIFIDNDSNVQIIGKSFNIIQLVKKNILETFKSILPEDIMRSTFWYDNR